jgi:hypothetical protein
MEYPRAFRAGQSAVTCIEKANRSLANGNSARMNGILGFRQLFPANDLSDRWHVELKKHGEQGGLFRGFDDLTLRGNVDR